MQKCKCLNTDSYNDNQGLELCLVCNYEKCNKNPLAVPKKDVTAMLKKLGDEYKLPPWNRTSTVLLEAMDTMNRMYAYGVNKDEQVPKKFDLEAALAGAEVQTRDGRKVTGIRVVSEDSKTMYAHEPEPVQGLRATIHNKQGPCEHHFYLDGGAAKYLGETLADLVMKE